MPQRKMFGLFLLTILVGVGSVLTLRLEDGEEGSCRGIRYQPVPGIDPDFIKSLTYVPAANRYYLYRTAAGHPRFSRMGEFDLYYNICLERNVTFPGRVSEIGFGGRVLATYTFRHRREHPGVLDTIPIPPDGSYDPLVDRLQQFITLTDNKTFAFLATCWVAALSDHRSWNVISLTPELSNSTKRHIENHAISMGFQRQEMVFLSYQNCDIGQGGYDDDGLRGRSGGKSRAVNPFPVNNSLEKYYNDSRESDRGGGGKSFIK